MRYYKGLISLPILFHYFVMNQKRYFFQSHISYGIPGVQVSQSAAVLVFHPSFCRGGRDTDASLKRKDNYFNE